jgi:carboxypeptidase C (cathepsin A)
MGQAKPVIQAIEGFTITVMGPDGKRAAYNAIELLNVNGEALSEEYMQQAALYGHFAVLTSMAEDYRNRADFDKDVEYARTDSAVREAAAVNDQKMTEPQVKACITTDAEYIAKQAAYFEAEYQFKLLKAITDALKQRADMLISLGSQMRKEMDMTGMNIRSNEVHDLDQSISDVKSIMRSKRGK